MAVTMADRLACHQLLSALHHSQLILSELHQSHLKPTPTRLPLLIELFPFQFTRPHTRQLRISHQPPISHQPFQATTTDCARLPMALDIRTALSAASEENTFPTTQEEHTTSRQLTKNLSTRPH